MAPVVYFHYSGIEKCCKVSCCYFERDSNFTTTTEIVENTYSGLSPDDDRYRADLETDDNDTQPLYKQPSFWILNIMIVFLILTFLKSVYTVVMPPKIVRILKEMSKGPFNTAKESTSGAIEPVVHYFVPNTQQRQLSRIAEHKDKAKQWLKDKIPSDDLVELFQTPVLISESDYDSVHTSSQMLDAQRLLTLQLESLNKARKSPDSQTPILFNYCEHCKDINNIKNDNLPENKSLDPDPDDPDKMNHDHPTKQLDKKSIVYPLDDPDEKKTAPSLDDPDEESKIESHESKQHCCSQLISREPTEGTRRSSLSPLSIPLPAPLPPSYQPALPVPRVWSKTHTTERLYRYTHIEGIIYPPGYVP